MQVKIEPNNWIMFYGVPVIFTTAIRDRYLEQGWIKHKEGSDDGEMEFTEKYEKGSKN